MSEAVATFAGGCFWCMEQPFEELKGVSSVISGYSGGEELNPTYREVSAGNTGHAEVVQIKFDPAQVTYKELLDVFWMNIDPTTLDRQFADRGKHYRTAIFFHDEEQNKLASQSKKALASSGKFSDPIVTEITAFKSFYPAEAYHQDYYKTNPIRYKSYSIGSGRAGFLKKTWGKK